MPARLLPTIAIVLLFAASWLARWWIAPRPASIADTGPPQRIVALAPSITETLFALGLGERVVGVSRFCQFPPEARNRPKVGGLTHTQNNSFSCAD